MFYSNRIKRVFRGNAGMTFVEVLIAIGIAAIVSIGLYGSAIYTMRQTAQNVEQMYGLQIVNSAAAKVRAARYDKLTAADSEVGAGEFEQQFFGSNDVYMDSNISHPTSFTLTYNRKGFGQGVTGSGSDYSLTLGPGSADWAENEYKGHFLVITSGRGANQVAYIIHNGESITDASGIKTVQVKLTKNLDGTAGSGFGSSTSANSGFAIDYGMYCEITATWGNENDFRTISETVYVATN